MNFEIDGGGFNLPLANFLKTENIKLELAFLNFTREERKGNQNGKIKKETKKNGN